MRKTFYFSAFGIVFVMLMILQVGSANGACGLPDFASASFSNPLIIDNPYFPLVPGTMFVYEPVPNDDNEVNTVIVTDNIKTITVNGKSINCREVHDFLTVGGVLSEDTLDWFAQDDDGNVWYCGEDTTVFLPDGGTDKTGSWEAGQDVAHLGVTALPGFVMLAEPKPGVCYRQEFYPSQAEDRARVMRLNAKVELNNGNSYEDCLLTKEWSTLELGDIEQKFYAKGVGLVLNFEHHGKRVRIELISVTSTLR